MSDSIHVVVIGAGIAGLSVAISTKIANPSHQVTILESVKELAEVGAGLQLTPNATRLFKPWGIYDRLVPNATFPKALNVRRYDGTKLLATETRFQEQIAERYGSPFWDMHRVDLQRAMAERCNELGITIRLSAKVMSVDFALTTVTLESGKKISGDVLLCADGLWSLTRSQFLGKSSPALLTGDLAYRIVINTNDLSGPDASALRQWIADSTVNFWIGPKTHVVAYTMRAGAMYNIVLLCPDTLPLKVMKSDGDLEEMKMLFEGWDPILMSFLAQVKAVAKWRLMHLDTLESWASEDGRFLMLGDSCHPMLPYLAQGANSSLEDGAVLGWLLGKVKREEKEVQLINLARMYQELRKGRGEDIARETFKQREDFHLEDGEKQRERDKLFEEGEEAIRDGRREGFPSRWTCPRVQKWLYGYDAYEVVERAWQKDPF